MRKYTTSKFHITYPNKTSNISHNFMISYHDIILHDKIGP